MLFSLWLGKKLLVNTVQAHLNCTGCNISSKHHNFKALIPGHASCSSSQVSGLGKTQWPATGLCWLPHSHSFTTWVVSTSWTKQQTMNSIYSVSLWGSQTKSNTSQLVFLFQCYHSSFKTKTVLFLKQRRFDLTGSAILRVITFSNIWIQIWKLFASGKVHY